MHRPAKLSKLGSKRYALVFAAGRTVPLAPYTFAHAFPRQPPERPPAPRG